MTKTLKNGKKVEVQKTKTVGKIKYFLVDYVWLKESDFEKTKKSKNTVNDQKPTQLPNTERNGSQRVPNELRQPDLDKS